MGDYGKMTNEEFDNILVQIVTELPTGEILSIGNVYSELAEEFNNDVLERWKQQQEKVIPLDDREFMIVFSNQPGSWLRRSKDDKPLSVFKGSFQRVKERLELWGATETGLLGFTWFSLDEAVPGSWTFVEYYYNDKRGNYFVFRSK